MSRCIDNEHASIPKVVVGSRERPESPVEDGWREEGCAVEWNRIGLMVQPIRICRVAIPQEGASPFSDDKSRIREVGRIADAAILCKMK